MNAIVVLRDGRLVVVVNVWSVELDDCDITLRSSDGGLVGSFLRRQMVSLQLVPAP